MTPNTLAVGIMVTSSNSFVSGANVYSIDRATNITESVSFAGPRNSTASANIGSITNTQNISVISDVIGNFLNVPLNANNYSAVPPALIQMSWSNHERGMRLQKWSVLGKSANYKKTNRQFTLRLVR